MQQATKGQFALYSQTVQMICHKFLTNIDNTQQARNQNKRLRYPYKDKRFYPLYWPAQAVSVEPGRVVLPMGRGRQSLVLHLDLPADTGACTIAWNDGYELHVAITQTRDEEPPGAERAAIDLGEIHQAAVTTSTGVALVVSGRGIRSIKRRRNQALGTIARKRARCKKGSKRWRKLQRARRKVSARTERQVRDLRHKGIRQVVNFCVEQHVGTVYIGNPDGVRRRPAGRHHSQRMAQWEYGRDIDYLIHKCAQRHIESFTGTERGTSSRCPVCGRMQRKPKGREWVCRELSCGFCGHRDVVGSANMHRIAYGQPIPFPHQITYRRPGPVRVRARNEQPRPVVRTGKS
ncbi:MAG TPA: transposase [Ktedonobacterales bacterium]